MLEFCNVMYQEKFLETFTLFRMNFVFIEPNFGYCPNEAGELDPTDDSCAPFSFPVFSPCKNDCPGGENTIPC